MIDNIQGNWVPSVKSKNDLQMIIHLLRVMLKYFEYMQLVFKDLSLIIFHWWNHIFWTILACNGFLWVLKPFIYKISFNILPMALINGLILLKIRKKRIYVILCQLQLLCGYFLHSWESFLHFHSSLEVCVK